MSDTWTIGELAEHAARALRLGTSPPTVNGRVRDVPGERLIRWYTTIGLVDPPLTRRGRIARYGRRHLLQLVAVKRLQAAGRSIAEIQTALTGATDRMLEAAAQLGDTPATDLPDVMPPGGVPAQGAPPALDGQGTLPARDGQGALPALDGHAGPGGGSAARHDLAPHDSARHGSGRHGADGHGAGSHDARFRGGRGDRAAGGSGRPEEAARGRFWAERPSAGHTSGAERPDGATENAVAPGDTAAPAGLTPDTAIPDSAMTDRAQADGAPAGGSVVGGRVSDVVVAGVRLGGGVRLVWDAGRVPSEEDVQAMLAAAGPLLAVLKERELI
ncbi:MerR HTH family regulatory protein [Nonomuraea solani]|uniref:MerR HTH family regulatory protein n=1 Tax=Nonomuraea solani TaxID=1144553 RepID=A0A1H6DHB7_9ACTN|nr:MerR family transcriptional regulator [Nonomuraea solani]SEG84620.1 MerR HTH family regulatory protein [Nonomuraea solani]